MKDNKPWYEKFSIWVGIGASICTILGITVFGVKDICKDNKTDDILAESKNIELKTGDQASVSIVNGDSEVINNYNFGHSMEQKDTISLNVNEIDLKYAVATDERFKNVFFTDITYYEDYTDLSEFKSEYYVNNNCVTIMNISNHSDYEIKINKFRVVADKIEQNLEPVITTSLVCGSSVDIEIANEGWSDIGNLKITILDKENLLLEYYDKKDLFYEIPELKMGETKILHILDKSLMKKIPDVPYDNPIHVLPIFVFDSDEISVSKEEMSIGICNEGPYVGDYGDSGACVYGIKINTDNAEYSEEFSINECVDAGDILDIPICFFPDKSCKMRFYVEFDIYNGFDTKTIKSEVRYLDFNISSLCSEWSNIDVSTLDLRNVYQDEEYFKYITFPYNKFKK